MSAQRFQSQRDRLLELDESALQRLALVSSPLFAIASLG